MIFQAPYTQRAADPAEGVDRLEKRMLALPQEPCPVVHRFGPGIYIREVTLPTGAFVIGHKQTTEHLNIMLRGSVRMADGTVLSAPLIFTGKPGKKCGTVLEEAVWLNVYATTETDVEKLEATYLEKSDAFVAHKPEQQGVTEAQADYLQMLQDLGVSAETVTAQSENPDDQTAMPLGSYKFQIAPSQIHGRGVFACGDIETGEVIGVARLSGLRTPLGRFTNHSGTPNARMVVGVDGIDLLALRHIEGNRGGQPGEEITVDYRTSVEVACQA